MDCSFIQKELVSCPKLERFVLDGYFRLFKAVSSAHSSDQVHKEFAKPSQVSSHQYHRTSVCCFAMNALPPTQPKLDTSRPSVKVKFELQLSAICSSESILLTDSNTEEEVRLMADHHKPCHYQATGVCGSGLQFPVWWPLDNGESAAPTSAPLCAQCLDTGPWAVAAFVTTTKSMQTSSGDRRTTDIRQKA